jgi:hypothetical protein
VPAKRPLLVVKALSWIIGATVPGNLEPNFRLLFRTIALVRSFTDLPTRRGLGCPRFGGKYREVCGEVSERAVRVHQLPSGDRSSGRAAIDVE